MNSNYRLRSALFLFMIPTIIFHSVVDAHGTDRRGISIRSLTRTLSLDEKVSIRAASCALGVAKKSSKSLVSVACKKGKRTGSITQKGNNLVAMGNKTSLKVLSNRCELLITQASQARIDVRCQSENPGTKATRTPVVTIKGGNTATPTNTPTATPTPTNTPTPTLTPNAQILLSNNSIASINAASLDHTLAALSSGIPAEERMVAITRRPRNNMLYGLGYNSVTGSVRLYLVSPRTGWVQSVSGGSPKSFTGDRIGVDANSIFSMDVNPLTDRIRVVVDNGDNFRINPNTGSLIDGDLGGDPVDGLNKDAKINGETSGVQQIAHSNTGVVSSKTTLYAIDSVNDELYIQNPQIGGKETDPLPLNPLIDSIFGFDIGAGVDAVVSNARVTSGSGSIGFASNGVTQLGSINLLSGLISNATKLPDDVANPVSLAVSANKLNSYPVILLTDSGDSLSRMDAALPSKVVTLSISGVAAGEKIVAIDFRPADGKLIGLGINATANTGTLYLIDPHTPVAAAIGATGQIAFVNSLGVSVDFPSGPGWGMDINPKSDRVRVVTSTGLNFRVVPSTGSPVDFDLSIGGVNPDGELNGANISSDRVAFTNNIWGTSFTTQYNLDLVTQRLYVQSAPDAGTLKLIAPLTDGSGAALNFTSASGLDISNDVFADISNRPATSGKAIAVLTVAGVQGLYEIDLVTGVTQFKGAISANGIVDLAVGYKEVY